MTQRKLTDNAPNQWRFFAAAAVVLLVTLLSLKAMGRVFWCKCETWIPWSWDIWSQHNSQHLLDPYFFTHVLHGVILYGVLHWLWRSSSMPQRFLATVIIEAAWEILENSPLIINRYREATISLDYFGDSIANSLFDILSCAMGFVLASRLALWQSVAFALVNEVALLIAIRDCLTLNVLMLIWPIDAVKAWQMG